MTSETVQSAAKRLLTAYSTRSPIDPITAEFPDADVSVAYEIARIQVQQWEAASLCRLDSNADSNGIRFGSVRAYPATSAEEP